MNWYNKHIVQFIVVAVVFLTNKEKVFSQGDVHAIIDTLDRRLDTYKDQGTRTSVYIRTNKDIYVLGEDLWFNAFVLNAQTFNLSRIDRTLYLQLQQKGVDTAVWQEMYPISNGISSGHVSLPQTLKTGDYLLKAYTAHSFFSGQQYFYAVTPIRIIKESREALNYGKSAHTINETIQFGLFPEGGNLIAGLRNKVAFKAVGIGNKPMNVSGVLLKNNVPLLKFRSVHSGMGSFVFTPEKNVDYRVKLENYDSLYMLPPIQDSGSIMSVVKNHGDSLIFKIFTTKTSAERQLFLRLQIRGMVIAIAGGRINGSLEIKLPIKNSPQGIAEATLFDGQLRPLAERLVYLHLDKEVHINISQIRKSYDKKGKVLLKIKTTDPNGNPVSAVLSMRVYDRLFNNPGNVSDIVDYYNLCSQLRGNIYDPSYYFDSSHLDRDTALDLLLLTQGWRRYTWNEAVLQENRIHERPVFSDSIKAYVRQGRKAFKEKEPLSLLMFNYNKKITQISSTDDSGKFSLTPANLLIGPRFFIKYFSKKEFQINIPDQFDYLKAAETKDAPINIFAEKDAESTTKNIIDTSDILQYGKALEDVTVVAKGRGFGDKYLGYLDSIAKYETTDYVGSCGWLNCPADRTDVKPIEGKTYHEFTITFSVHRNIPINEHTEKTVIYHYPKYTKQELLKKFQTVITKGYYQSREFYEPNYDKESSSVSDMRNTLYWNPEIVTDKNGEAAVQFFCSDIHSGFVGIVEGVDGEGMLGTNKFNFGVK